jgi:hypothetical protein
VRESRCSQAESTAAKTEGHLSSTLPYFANISYRVGRSLVFDGKAEPFVDDKKADRLLTREYRKGFQVPNSFT